MRAYTKGFTLAELLIALAILGVIATFTIPKVLQSTTSGQNTAIAKEAASMVSGAFSAYTLNNTVSGGTTAGVLTSFMNYVKVDTATTSASFSTPPASQSNFNANCAAATPCMVLHNGAMMQYSTTGAFNGSTTTAAVIFNVDPDGTGANAGRISFVQYINGRITTGANAATYNTTTGGVDLQATDPSYLTNWN